MKRFLKVFFLVAFFTATLFVCNVQAHATESGYCGDDVTYTLEDNGKLTISGSGDMTSHPWVSTTVKTVVINYGVTSIGEKAFDGCYNIISLTIPSSVTSIGKSAFKDCSSLKSITIPKNVTSIGDSAFANCSSLTSITIPNNVTGIGSTMFSNCLSLTSITISSSVTSIGSSAFYNCKNLTSITIPGSVTSIDSSAFDYCGSLTSIAVSSGNSVYHSKNNCIIETSSKTLIRGGKNSVIPGDGRVTSIGRYAFSGCSSLTSITIPDSVTSIGTYAFSGCRGLTNLTIPDSVTSIGKGAFYGCSGLIGITIPFVGATKDGAGNKYLGYIFGATYSGYNSSYIPATLKKVVVTGGTSIGSSAFYNCSGLTSITIPNSVTSIGSSAFSGCSGLTSITIPNSVTNIGGGAFNSCSGLTSITVEDGNSTYFSNNNCLIEISSKTLILGCKNSIIPDDGSVTIIGAGAFNSCSGLTSITIPNSVTSIGGSAFSICTGLKSITIPGSVTSIGSYAFSNCTGLTSITIPGSVVSIGDSVFNYCISLTSIVFEGNAPTFRSNCFYNVTATVKYPCNKSSWDTIKGNNYGGSLTWEAINHAPAASVEERRVNPTLSQDGSYDRVVYCSVCRQELRRETIVIPKLVSNIVKFPDGKWYYTVNGEKDLTFTGFASNVNGRFRVEKGVVNFKYTDIAKDENEWRYYSGGKWQTGVTSVEKRSNATWWYVKKGVVQFGTNSVVKRTENNTWWYVKNGQVQFNYTGFASNANGRFRIVKGQVNFKYTDIVKDGNEWRYYSGGKWQIWVTSVEKRSNGTWWYVEEGVVQFGVTGLVRRTENNTYWYVKGGQVQTKLTNVVEISYGNAWYIKNGQVQTKATGIVKCIDNNTWWYVENGKVQFDFTGIAKKIGENSRWYVKNGKVQTSYSGTIKIRNYYSEETYKISKGRVK